MRAEEKSSLLDYARKLAMQSDSARGRLEAFGGAESFVEALPIPESEMDTLRDVVRGQDIDDDAAYRLEAIILPGLRPVFDIYQDSYQQLPGEWSPMNEAACRERVENAIRAIGRINLIGHPRMAYGGTGFIVGPNLLLTNRHVAGIFTEGLGDSGFRLLFESQVDLKEEVKPQTPVLLKVKGAALVHPHWDAAILRVEGIPENVKPLELASDSSGFGNGKQVAIIGYPAMDPRSNIRVQRDVFSDTFEKKRLQPGYLTGLRVIQSFGHAVEAVTHDASTLGGNSGSAAIDPQTGVVVALHFAGIYKDANFAVPAWELGLDPRVTALGVNFAKFTRPNRPPAPDWLNIWTTLRREAPSGAGSTPGPASTSATTAGVAATASGPCELSVMIPIHVTVRVGNPICGSGADQPSVSIAARPVVPGDSRTPLDDLREAKKRIAEDPSNYFDAARDASDIATYYSGIQSGLSRDALYRALSTLLRTTHKNKPRYKPTVHLYPVVDLHPDGDLVSIYSGAAMDPEELIRAEMPLEAIRESAESTMTESALAGLEALLENSAEHVVPQSWFKEREPMRGDLHHLFACEKRCNSFRSNIPFFEFTEEKVMEDCGRREALAFEPKGGKGAVARAVLYFLMRYPGEINNRSTEYTPDRIDILLRWHNEFPPDLYEQHRNREIFLKQGNRNPLIDHKEWASRINFRLGLGA